MNRKIIIMILSIMALILFSGCDSGVGKQLERSREDRAMVGEASDYCKDTCTTFECKQGCYYMSIYLYDELIERNNAYLR